METSEETPLTGGSSVTCSERAKSNCPCLYLNAKTRLALNAGIWGLLTGMERAIIFPTLWLYFFKIFSLQAAVTYYGITLAAFNLSVLLSSPIYGYLGHRGVPVKLLLLISNQLEVVGNVIYFVAGQPYLVLIGRFVAGLGGGSEVSLYADIVRATTVAERTPLIVVLLLARQFGLIVGPAATLLMHPINVTVGKVNFNVYNMPGLFMAILWAADTIILILTYPSIPKPVADVVSESEGNSDAFEAPNEDVEKEEKEEKEEQKEQEDKKEEVKKASASESLPRKRSASVSVRELSWRESIKYYLKLEVAATVACTFAAYFALMALEAVLPPLAKTYFDWDEVRISYVYLACGIAVIVVYAGLRLLSNFFSDRSLLSFGLAVLAAGYLYFTGVMVAINDSEKSLYIGLILVGIGIHVLGQPFLVACSESLYTKLVPRSDLDRGQSYLRFTINFSILIGPYIGGSFAPYPYVVFMLMSLAIGISIVLTTASYSELNRNSNEESEQ